MSKSILRLPEVKARTGLGRSTIYSRMNNGTFPKKISLGQRMVGWIESEISDWIDAQISKDRNNSLQK